MAVGVEDSYALLYEVGTDSKLSAVDAYRLLRDLLERLCRHLSADEGLQLTDLSARISHVAARLGLTVAEQNRLHTFRLASNEVLNRRATPGRDALMRDVKTLSFFVRRLSGQDIPPRLYALLPRADATWHALPPAAGRVERMRVIFHHADDNYLYVQPVDRVDGSFLPVRYNVPQVNDEFARTCASLWPGAQLNLLDADRDEAGRLTPAFLVLEPDYLVDVSTLAECFKEYGHHPLNYIYARLNRTSNTAPLLLGNLANLFLDEWIYADGEPDYRACMQKAFRRYPLELAACSDLLDPEKERAFFADCRRHFEHIRQVVTQLFPAPGYGLDRRDAVLEPSYLCEALGLQGRLDYLQRDLSAFIEMKSGKADEYSLRGRIEPKENNRIQMLLYLAMLQYSLGKDHHSVRAYLLYTRYPLLYPARASWAMVRRAIDVRNRIVAAEYAVQRHNDAGYTARLLHSITPEELNERHLDNRLWNQYMQPSIAAFGCRLSRLSPLEERYFCTLYNFITKELYTSKSGDAEYGGHMGASSLWLSTLEEKKEAGEIIADLVLTDNRAADMERPLLVFALPEPLLTLPNFRPGDAVLLYERNGVDDLATNHIVFKGTLEEITDTSLCVRLRAPQRNAAVLPATSRYAMEHDSMDTSFRSMYLGLSAFLDARQERRDLLLGRRLPDFDRSLDARILSEPDVFRRIALKAEAARDIFLLQGPPGTGKTSFALRTMVENFYHAGKQLLLLSYTNRAVDEICRMLSRISPSVDFIRIGGELSCAPAYYPHLMGRVLASCANRQEVQRRISACRVFVGTISTLSLHPELFALKAFDVAIVDEATQVLEPQLLGLFCARSPLTGDNAVGKFVLIGDHKQLPAVVLQPASQSEVEDEELRSLGLLNLKDSLFERLYRRFAGWTGDRPGEMAGNGILPPDGCGGLAAGMPFAQRCYDMLRRQGRMNVEVSRFPNEAFYGSLLEPVGLPHQYGELHLAKGLETDEFADLLTRRVAFLPSEPEPMTHSPKTNHCEARIVARLAAAIYRQYSLQECFDPEQTLGIIAPYRNQIALIRQELLALDIDKLSKVTVDTVERFQGSERDVIIYSFCLNRAFQLDFLANVTEEDGNAIDRKLNVALTRARRQMFITGVPSLMRLNPVYARLLEMLGVSR